MAEQLIPVIIRALDANGEPVAAAEATWYEAGTTTPLTVYTDTALSTAAATPQVADASGVFPQVFVAAGVTAKVDVVDPDTAASLPGYPLDNIALAPDLTADRTIAGDWTWTGVIGLSGTDNRIQSKDTGDPTTHNQIAFVHRDEFFGAEVRDDADAFVDYAWLVGVDASGAVSHKLRIGSEDQFNVDNVAWWPGTDDAVDAGKSTRRLDDVYATNATIQTSDEREKRDFRGLTDAEKRAALRIKDAVQIWRWKKAVEEKGDNARWHTGPVVQTVIGIMEDEGIENPYEYAFVIGHPDETTPVTRREKRIDGAGNVTYVDVPTGETRYVPMGLRATELQWFVLAAL